MSSWPDGTQVGRTGVEFEALTSPGTRCAEFHPAGDGVTDDYVDLQAAIVTAYGTGLLEFDPDKTYCVGTGLTITSPLVIRGNGATIIKTTTLNDLIITITGADVIVFDLNLDGNRVGGNTNVKGNISFGGLRGQAWRVKSTNAKHSGILATGTGVELDCYDCEASSIVSTATTGEGFLVGAGAVMRTWGNCVANNNGHCGFHISASSADGCHVDGTAINNQFCGVSAWSDYGTSTRIRTANNQSYGIYATAAVGWTFNYVEDDDCGTSTNAAWSPNLSATSVELVTCDYFDFTSILSRDPLGYGVALSGAASVGSTYNTFGRVVVNTPGDPGVFLGSNSQYNHFGDIRVRGDFAVSFGEGLLGNNNDYNSFGYVHAVDCGYSVIHGTQAHYNTFGHVHATNCWNRPGWVGMVQWIGPDVSHNTVQFFGSENPGSPPGGGATLPSYVMNCDATASHNWIASGYARTIGTAVMQDLNGTNRVDFAAAP